MRHAYCGLVSLDSLQIDIALMPSYPSILEQRFVAAPGCLRERRVGLRPLHRGLELVQRGFVLGNLLVELGDRELSQQLTSFDVVADVGITIANVTSGASVDIRRGEGGRGAGQGDRGDDRARLNWRHSNRWREAARLVG